MSYISKYTGEEIDYKLSQVGTGSRICALFRENFVGNIGDTSVISKALYNNGIEISNNTVVLKANKPYKIEMGFGPVNFSSNTAATLQVQIVDRESSTYITSINSYPRNATYGWEPMTYSQTIIVPTVDTEIVLKISEKINFKSVNFYTIYIEEL